jgi:hypothetical protein
MEDSKGGFSELGELLNQIYKDIESPKIEPCSYGFYKEKEIGKFLGPKEKNPYGSVKWNFKTARPLKIVEVSSEEVIFVLTTSKAIDLFSCPQEHKYHLNKETPKVNFFQCETKVLNCKWIHSKESFIFKRPHKGFCLIWTLPKKVFQEFATVCGKCKSEVFPDEGLKKWIKDEVNRYKQMIERRYRKK